MSAGDPAFPRRPSYREISERAVGGSKADPNNVQEQLRYSKAKRAIEKKHNLRRKNQSTDSNQ